MRRVGLLLALFLCAAPAHALEVVLDYSYDESGFFDDPGRRAVLERAVRLYTRALDAELGELPEGEWAAVFPHPGRANSVVYRELGVARSALHVFVGSHPRSAGEPARGVPGYAAWRCEAPDVAGACALRAAARPPAEQLAWLERFAFRGNPAALARPARAFAPWGGSLSFASDADWYTGLDGPVPPGRVDLLSSAVHALGHLFGVGTSGAWAARSSRGVFDGAQVHARAGDAVGLTPDRMHFAGEVMSHVAGAPQTAAFAPALVAGQRVLLTELDEAALRDVGWTRASAASSTDYVLKGDVDGDLAVDLEDVLALEAFLAAPADEHEQSEAQRALVARVQARWATADVAPMLDGESLGDDRLDASDAALLRRAIRVYDVDGDGIPTALENELNQRFAASAGPLVYQPLGRRADACATSPGHALLAFVSNGRAAPFCSADGAAWFAVPFAPLRPPPLDGAFVPDGMQLAPIAAERRSGSAHSFDLSSTTLLHLGGMSVPMAVWSLQPEVSPELYLETVRAEARLAASAAPVEVEAAAPAAVSGPGRGRPPELPARRSPAIAPPPTDALPDAGAASDPAVRMGPDAPPLVPSSPAPEAPIDLVAQPAVELAADEPPELPPSEPVADAPAPPSGGAGPMRSHATLSAAAPPERPEALLSRLLDALSALWARLRAIVGF
jgi:hypothetical protein